ncbi:5223_t:CDS:2 [Paraglomus occultum]|uniref:Acyl carrier protein n=1 Tax=Paraglomus occultum TaxID=144539 RepID=A0A9N8WSF6_9GLOM|nr:5223_t:CDS:2 [Paraglomus occultum]
MNRLVTSTLRLRSAGFSIFHKAQPSILSNPTVTGLRHYASGALDISTIENRILDILRGFDKVPAHKLSADSHFVDDLGLDSLDTVEVVMAIEEDFSVEIPDKDADNIRSVSDAVKYISHVMQTSG